MKRNSNALNWWIGKARKEKIVERKLICDNKLGMCSKSIIFASRGDITITNQFAKWLDKLQPPMYYLRKK